MCRILKVNRSLVYYEPADRACESKLTDLIIEIFKRSRSNYGTRKIKRKLIRLGQQVSRRRIGRIMKASSLVSNYTQKQYRVVSNKSNEDLTANIVNRNFDRITPLEVVVSDLTYVNVNGKWNYICVLLDLFNREFIGYAAGKNKDAQIVHRAFATIKRPLSQVQIFHTDRGNEFKNKTIDSLLKTFNISRSLSKKGCPFDNAVAEAAMKILKTEFASRSFSSFEELEYLLFDYINWYNNYRIHSSLDYLTPVEHRLFMSDKKVS